MALKFKLDTLDGLDEAAKTFYKPGPDGKGFVLDMDDDPAKETIAKIRKERDDLEKSLKEREKQEADAKAAKEREELEKKGEYEKLRAQDAAEKEALAKKLQDAMTQHETHLKESLALSLLAPVAANSKTLESLKREFVEKLEVVQGKVLVKGDPSTTPDKFAAAMTADPEYAPFLKPTGATGGGASTHQGGTTPTAKARYDELSAKPDLNRSEGLELVRLGAELTKPATK